MWHVVLPNAPVDVPSLLLLGDSLFPLLTLVARKMAENAFSNPLSLCCQYGSISVSKRLISHTTYTPSDEAVMEAMLKSCYHGKTEMVQWLSANFFHKISELSVKYTVLTGFLDSCKNGHFEIVKFLVDKYGYCLCVTGTMFFDICYQCHFDIVNYIIKYVTTYVSDSEANKLFVHFCTYGQTELAKWILQSLTASRRRVNSLSLAFQKCCENGHLDTLLWLGCYMNDRSIRADHNLAFRSACAAGRIEVAQWMLQVFHLTTEDARACNNFALQASLDNGHLQMAKWLASQFGLTRKDAIEAIGLRVYPSDTAAWLKDHFML